MGPGILDRKTGLMYGQGPMLYRVNIVNNERVQEWLIDDEIQGWLETWDYRSYIRNAFVEYNHMKGVFVKYYAAKSIRIGKPWITRLEALHSTDCRMVWPENDSRRLEDVKQFLIGDFDSYTSKRMMLYSIFDKWNPLATETAIKYHSMRSFGRNMYAISSFHGSIPWLLDANTLPEIIQYLNENLIASAYIVHEPEEYWRQKEEMVAGKKNAGKFFTCVDFVDQDGNLQSWKIEPIEMNVDKYISAQAEISRIADSSTTSGFGLNPALSNIIIDGKGDSGSQMLYALKIFYGADTQIPEEIVLEALNDAIRINFPHKKGIFIGMYRKVINKEDNVTAGERVTNQV